MAEQEASRRKDHEALMEALAGVVGEREEGDQERGGSGRTAMKRKMG